VRSVLRWGDDNLDELTAWAKRLSFVVATVMLLTMCTEVTQVAYRMGYDDAKAGKPSALESDQ
jgi:hypothetical protein